MSKDVLISIYGLQEVESGESDNVTLVTKGKFSKKGTGFLVSYYESELTGLEGTKTTLSIDSDIVVVERTGLYPSQLIFEKGKRHTSLYHTEFGDLIIGVETRQIKNEIDDFGGTLDVMYSVEIDHALAGTNHLKLSISCDGENSFKI